MSNGERRFLLSNEEWDITTHHALSKSPAERREYLVSLLTEIDSLMAMDVSPVTLRKRVGWDDYEAAMRRLWEKPADRANNQFLKGDDATALRNVLTTGSPMYSEHKQFAQYAMWRMVTSEGDLRKEVREVASGEARTFTKKSSLLGRLDRLLDGTQKSKTLGQLRAKDDDVLPMLYSYIEGQYNLRTAFPPFHAKFLAEQFLPTDRDSIVVDPCAGWGGRLLGTLFVRRARRVTYIGVDPNGVEDPQQGLDTKPRMPFAYAMLTQKALFFLNQHIDSAFVPSATPEPWEIGSADDDWVDTSDAKRIAQSDPTHILRARRARVFPIGFEDWIRKESVRLLFGKVDLVMTSPPYFNAENYDSDNPAQSANRYRTYEEWRVGFYRPLIQGAYDLLRPGGVFVLNVANVDDGLALEQDAKSIAYGCGFRDDDPYPEYRLAMPMTLGTRSGKHEHEVSVNGTPYKYEPCFCLRKPA